MWCHFELTVHWSIKGRGGWEKAELGANWNESLQEAHGAVRQMGGWKDQAHREMFTDDAAKKGERLWYVPITTNNRRNNNCEDKLQKERWKAHCDLTGILFAVLLRLSHPTIMISIDLTILFLCLRISVKIIYEYHFCFLSLGLKFIKG